MNSTHKSIALVFLLALSSFLRADGGTIRLLRKAGNYRVAVFTAPTPLRAGPVDISVLVQDASTNDPINGARVTVRLTRADGEDELSYPATTEAATNKLFHAAKFELPSAGRWELTVEVEGPHGDATVRTALEAAGPLPRWLELWPLLGWPAVVVLLFCVHQFLVARRDRKK
jgi:hypothetical protein